LPLPADLVASGVQAAPMSPARFEGKAGALP
jgi:hypothetical protein